ncbi:AAA family ATPase [Flexithrix dorotheae]|uniref:AAA family ATPase n=1 Tax=Flexithrix dorotheae TaxID=70993 RepID=UPI00038071A8|nr:AAA family ATPase [Flexithrix dorotheae]
MQDLNNPKDFFWSINEAYIHDYKFFYKYFGRLPNVCEIRGLKLQKAIKFFEVEFESEIKDVFFKKAYNYKKKKPDFEEVFYILKNDVVVAFNDHHICRVMSSSSDNETFDEIAQKLKKCRLKSGKKPHQMNLITMHHGNLDLSVININKTKLDIPQNYNEDFLPVHDLIVDRLNQKDDKGIVLLHGLPGTGKTTYLRHLMGIIKKRMTFVPPNVAASMANPDFINILIDNPNSVLIIEDAENIVINRNNAPHSAVSTLLNIADGLLSDCLNIQIICTFNVPITSIDDALLRKGRLIAKYEFGKLTVDKAQELSDSLNFNTKIEKEMTLSDIYNQTHPTFHENKQKKIGF